MYAVKKIVLGTAQFGLDYGISNQAGMVTLEEMAEILDFCRIQGLDCLDTAAGYGESEHRLGQFDLTPFKIITKLIGAGELALSLEKLRVGKVYGLMFHREDEVTDTAYARFVAYKQQGMTEKIGVSVYSPQCLAEIIDRYEIDLVQLPLNLLDQRFVPMLSLLHQRGIEVHTRSAFLQGLLLMNPEQVHPYFDAIKPKLSTLPQPRLAHALRFCLAQECVDKIVVGCTSLRELQEIVQSSSASLDAIDYTSFQISEEQYINPSLWNITR